MKSHRFLIVFIFVQILLGCFYTALADDVFVPSWRGLYRTVNAGCTIWSDEDVNGNGTGALVYGPSTNPGWGSGSLPYGWARYHNAHEQYWSAQRQSVIEVHPGGDITIGLDNYDGGVQKMLLLQITFWAPLPGAIDVDVWSAGFDPNDPWPANPQNMDLIGQNQKDHDDNWITVQYELTMEPNPSAEVLRINFDETAYIDQIVIDTICFTVPDDIKWQQLPDKTPQGMDLRVDRNDQINRVIADDFLCAITEPITDIFLWGSWKDDIKGTINKINLSIYSDIPEGISQYPYSTPGTQLWSMDVTNFTEQQFFDLGNEYEWWWDPVNGTRTPNGDQKIWRYYISIDPNDAFVQRGTFNDPVIYWLGVYVETDGSGQFGWKTRDPNDGQFNDDAVYLEDSNWYNLTYPFPHPYVGASIDMSFVLKTKTEPHMDLGDAPDSTNSTPGTTMTAYPSVQAGFPTVYAIGSPPYGPLHRWPSSVAYLGSAVSFELEADTLKDSDVVNNIDPATDNSNLDDSDDGVSPLPKLPYCKWTTFDYDVTVITPGVNLYANVWFDWNRDGDWGDVPECGCCTAGPAPEWAVQNQLLYNLPAGTSTVTSSAFRPWHPDPNQTEEIWMRISLSEQPWTFENNAADPNDVAGSGPLGGYQHGETEDYKYTPDTSCVGCANLNCDEIVNLEDLAIFAQQWFKKCDE